MIEKNISKFFIVALLFAMSFIQTVVTQDTEQKPFFYGQVGLEGGNYLGFSLAGTYVFPSNYLVQVGYQGLVSNAEERPSDYQIGALDFFSFGLKSAKDTYNIFHASFGRILALNNHPKTRFNLMGGVGYAAYRYATNFKYSGGLFLVANYTFETEKDSSVFFIIQPKVEFCLSQYNGISVGPVIKLSERENLYGFSVNYIFGRLRNEIERAK